VLYIFHSIGKVLQSYYTLFMLLVLLVWSCCGILPESYILEILMV